MKKESVIITITGAPKTGKSSIMRFIADKLTDCGIEVVEKHLDEPVSRIVNFGALERIALRTRVVLKEEQAHRKA
jgi:adenylylsulfate kinase-like enzyme